MSVDLIRKVLSQGLDRGLKNMSICLAANTESGSMNNSEVNLYVMYQMNEHKIPVELT